MLNSESFNAYTTDLGQEGVDLGMGMGIRSIRRDFSRILLGATLLTPLALGGCGILPAAGPLGMDVLAGQRDPPKPSVRARPGHPESDRGIGQGHAAADCLHEQRPA